MPRGGKGYIYHYEAYQGPDNPQRLPGMPALIEYATLTCAHCGTVVILNPSRTRPREWCMRCDAYVCDKRVCVTECHPMKQSLDLLVATNKEQPFLLRGKEGEVLHDLKLEDQARIYPVGRPLTDTEGTV